MTDTFFRTSDNHSFKINIYNPQTKRRFDTFSKPNKFYSLKGLNPKLICDTNTNDFAIIILEWDHLPIWLTPYTHFDDEKTQAQQETEQWDKLYELCLNSKDVARLNSTVIKSVSGKPKILSLIRKPSKDKLTLSQMNDWIFDNFQDNSLFLDAANGYNDLTSTFLTEESAEQIHNWLQVATPHDLVDTSINYKPYKTRQFSDKVRHQFIQENSEALLARPKTISQEKLLNIVMMIASFDVLSEKQYGLSQLKLTATYKEVYQTNIVQRDVSIALKWMKDNALLTLSAKHEGHSKCAEYSATDKFKAFMRVCQLDNPLGQVSITETLRSGGQFYETLPRVFLTLRTREAISAWYDNLEAEQKTSKRADQLWRSFSCFESKYGERLQRRAI